MIKLFLAITVALVAQPCFATEVFTWQASVNRLIQNNADLQSAEASLQSTKANEGVARSGELPHLAASVSASRSSVATTPSTTVDAYGAGVTVSQNVFAGFRDVSKVEQAKANTRASSSNLQIVKAQLSYDLKSTYQSYLYAREYVTLASDIIKRRQENSRLVTLRFESGRENKGSVMLSDANLAQARYEERQAIDLKGVALAQVRRVLAMDDNADVDFKDPVPVHEPSITEPNFTSVATDTPNHSQAVAQADAAYAGVKIARSGFFPSLDFSGSVGKNDTVFFPQRDNWSLGATLTLPLFDGGTTYFGTQSASANYTAVEATRISVDQKLLASLRQAYTNYVEATIKLKVDQSYADAATTRAEIARAKYNNGLITFDDWDVIENDLILRQKNYLQSTRDRVVAEAAWEQAQGKGVVP